MAYVMAEACLAADAECINVCPLESIKYSKNQPGCGAGQMIYVESGECSDCESCVLECPLRPFL
jgi:NAD-dependent dihydropyrimidine dehydrogenase PreA subunit